MAKKIKQAQGAAANESGKTLEDFVRLTFNVNGVPTKGTGKAQTRFIEKNVPYTSIYGSTSRSEFVYRDLKNNRHIRIECRFQKVKGSVDEKMPYLFFNARDAMPEKEVWLVVSGGGAREKAVAWLKAAVAQVVGKTIRVMDHKEAGKAIMELCKNPAAVKHNTRQPAKPVTKIEPQVGYKFQYTM